MTTETYSSDVAFSPSVKAVQTRKGSRAQFEQMEDDGGWETTIIPYIQQFIESQTSIFLASANSAGQPYIQHRGGPRGFLKVLDKHTIGFVDFAGNQQYITLGNLADNPKVHLFLIDYARRNRLKIWGEARVVEDDENLIAQLMPAQYRARPSQVILIHVVAWDMNCKQHIPQRFEAVEVASMLAAKDKRIAELEQQLENLRAS